LPLLQGPQCRRVLDEQREGRHLSSPDDAWGIVLAAGSGSRLGEMKQFLKVGGSRLVDHSVRVTASVCQEVVLVLPSGYSWQGERVSRIVAGGETRIDSARRGLDAVPSSARIVLIHDAAHPLASKRLLDSLIRAVQQSDVDAVLPALPTKDTVMRVRGDVIFETIPREGLVWVQMPYVFKTNVLRAAHAHGGEATDESVLVQRLGARIKTIPGEAGNIHVATRDDLAIVARLLHAP
jgi:2-C-methyl-D-erythritol 4-phosphate cytidylyltransferase